MELFYHHKASPFVRKALLAIEELDLAVKERPIAFQAGDAMDAYAKVNPNRRFPALRDGDLVLWESNAILRHLAARHGPDWLGRTSGAQARVDQWLFWELAHLGPPLLGLQNLRLGFLPRPPRDEEALLADRDRAFDVLDAELAGRAHVADDAITVADLAVAALFSFADEATLLPPDRPHVVRWLGSVRARPSWQSTDRMKRETLAAFGVLQPELQ